MKQLTIRNRLFLLVGFITSCMLFVQCPKTCNHSNLSPTKSQQSIKQNKSKQDLLRVRQLPSRNAHYMEITIQSSNTGTVLSQCTLIATALAGHGILFAPGDKVKGRLQYNIRLTEETNLDKVYISKGNADMFKQGKSIKIKCMYQHEVGTQQGEDHQVQIKVCVYDSNHQILEQKAEKVSFLITQAPKPKEQKTTKSTKKPLSRTPKKSNQVKGIGKLSPPDDRLHNLNEYIFAPSAMKELISFVSLHKS